MVKKKKKKKNPNEILISKLIFNLEVQSSTGN